MLGALGPLGAAAEAAGRGGAAGARDGRAAGLSKPGGSSDSGASCAATQADVSASAAPASSTTR